MYATWSARCTLPPAAHTLPLAAAQVPVGESGEPMGPAEVTLRHCLGPRTRRWAMYEFQYSALDRPYFMRSELQELLHHAGLSHVSKLKRAEWGSLRAMLGKPRRLSLAFLREERVRLEHYRCASGTWTPCLVL